MENMHVDRFRVENGTDSFEAIRRDFRVNTETRQGDAETIFTTLGEYAIQQPPGEQWRLTPAEEWHDSLNRQHSRPAYRPGWVTIEEMRTRADEGTFVLDHLDALEKTLLEPYRVCNVSNKLDVHSAKYLGKLLTDYDVPTDKWRPAELQNLLGYIKQSGQAEAENVSLHTVGRELWLASAQTMVNVYYKDAENQTWRLCELQKRYFDSSGSLGEPVKSHQRSSLGETGHLINGVPERAADTARRGLAEEIGITDHGISQLVATGSLLRLKRQGHHRFGPAIKAEDSTHYFDVWLHRDDVQPEGYVNTELDSKQKPRVAIELGWSRVE